MAQRHQFANSIGIVLRGDRHRLRRTPIARGEGQCHHRGRRARQLLDVDGRRIVAADRDFYSPERVRIQNHIIGGAAFLEDVEGTIERIAADSVDFIVLDCHPHRIRSRQGRVDGGSSTTRARDRVQNDNFGIHAVIIMSQPAVNVKLK